MIQTMFKNKIKNYGNGAQIGRRDFFWVNPFLRESVKEIWKRERKREKLGVGA